MAMSIEHLIPLQTALRALKEATSIEDKTEASVVVRKELIKLGALNSDENKNIKEDEASLDLSGYNVISSWDTETADNKFQEILITNEGKYKTSAIQFFKEYLSGKAVKTSLGLVILNSKSKNKMTWQAKREPIALATPRIPEILLEGGIGPREPANKERSDSLIAFYEFSKIITVSNKDYLARIKVAERLAGDYAGYNLTSRQFDRLNNKQSSSYVPHWLNKSDLENQPSLRGCDELLIITSQDNNAVNDDIDFDDISQSDNVENHVVYEVMLNTFEVKEVGHTNSNLSDNPNDDNYRYADTGYIAGSRKEIAGNHIKQLAKEGVAVKVKDIDWSEIETDPLLAESLIKKSNIIGKFDYTELKDSGVEPGTAFLIQKVLASVAAEPHWDLVEFIQKSYAGYQLRRNKNQLLTFARMIEEDLGVVKEKQIMRKAYVVGIDTLKARISKCVTPRDLYNELKDIRSELDGMVISSTNSEKYNKLIEDKESLYKEMEYESEVLFNEAFNDLVKIAEQKGVRAIEYNLRRFLLDWAKDKYPNRNFKDAYIGKGVVDADKLKQWNNLDTTLKALSTIGAYETLTKDKTVQQWIALGERFWAIVELTSKAFVNHLNKANAGNYDDWSLTITNDDSSSSGNKRGKKKTTFELIVADSIERVGGRSVDINSTEDLKNAFGFREIQSGNWVLKDRASAEFHVKNAAAAMMDLSDVVGIDPKVLAFDGRLALAIGARGRRGALAHYEPVQRVINLTKMRGGGSLGHEWFHAIDNILGEVLGNEEAVGADNYLTENPDLALNPKISEAFKNLQDAMFMGDSYTPEVFKITEKDIELAKLNVNPDKPNRTTKAIIDAGNASAAVRAIDSMYDRANRSRRSKQHTAWRKVAAAYYNQDKAGQSLSMETGPLASKFKVHSLSLDGTRAKPYWSSTREMAARAFQAYIEDSLSAQERRNDYLSYGANNELYDNDYKAYPEGDERTRINAAFNKLFKVIKDENVFENAIADEVLMDSIFGMHDCEQPLDNLVIFQTT